MAPPVRAVALALLLLGSVLGPAAAAGTAGSVRGAAHPAFLRTSYHGNVSIAGAGPTGAVPVQSNLTISYELRDPSYGPQFAGLYVRVPIPAVTFNVSGGPVVYLLSAKSVPIATANWTLPTNTTFSILLPTATTFTGGANASRAAVFSSQTLALMSSLPYGSLTVDVRWSWNLTPSLGGGVATASGWLPNASGSPVAPDQFVGFTAPDGLSVVPGTSFTGCVNGATAGRTFSLHAETTHPFDDFEQVNATVPTDQTGPYCWSLPIPSYLALGPLLVRLWDYVGANGSGNVTTLLLYSDAITLVAPPPAPLPWYATPATLELLGGLALGVAVVLGIVTAWGRRRAGPPNARAAAPAATPPPGRSPPPAGAPPPPRTGPPTGPTPPS